MYVVAQRVLSPGGQPGVNAFLFLHGDSEIPGVSWEEPDIDIIADVYPGILALQRVEQPSGDNIVVSYLDIVAPDSLGIEQLGQVLLDSPVPLSNMATWSRGLITFRFVTQHSDHASEFRDLKGRALLLLLRPDKASPVPQRGPISILAQDVAGAGMVYRLAPEDSARTLENNVLTTAASVHVAYEDMDKLKQIWGNIEYHSQIALALTGIPREALRDLGGYEIRHVPTPLDSSMVAASRDISGQIDGDWIGPRSPVPPASTSWPTGALLLSKDGSRALDLVFVESAWFPMSEAALYTYLHSTGLQGGERWSFVARGSNDIFEVTIGPSLTRQEVAANYGEDAGARSRPDKKTVQLLLKRLPAS